MRKKYKPWKNPLGWYINYVKKHIEPTSPSHEVSMRVDIPKGKKNGRALIPCSIYTLTHTIDLNPALVRKRDKKVVKKLPLNKKIKYDSKKYDVMLTKEEKKKGYQLNEIERCSKCGLKTVIAEVCETRYRSCPDIRVKVSDKAKENLTIPVKFGVIKRQIFMHLFFPLILDFFLVAFFLDKFFHVDIIPLDNLITPLLSSFSVLGYILLIVFFGLAIHIAIVMHYSSFKLFKWYINVKPTLKKVKDSINRR